MLLLHRVAIKTGFLEPRTGIGIHCSNLQSYPSRTLQSPMYPKKRPGLQSKTLKQVPGNTRLLWTAPSYQSERCVQCDGQDPGDYCATRRPELSTCYADPFSAAQAIVRATARAPTTATARKRRGRRAAATATEICYSACRATVLLRIKDNLREDHASCS